MRNQYWRDGLYYGHHDKDNLLKGLVVGAAVMRVTAAIINAQDD